MKKLQSHLQGHGALSISKFLGISFIQEVVSCKRAIEKYIPQTDVAIELGRGRCKNNLF